MPDGFIQQRCGVDVMRASPVQCLPKLWPGDIPGGHAVAIGTLFALAGSFLAVEDVSLCDLGVAILNQHLLNHILDLLNIWYLSFRGCRFQLGDHLGGKGFRSSTVAPPDSNCSPVNGVGDPFRGEGYNAAIAFDYMGEFCHQNLRITPGLWPC